MYVCVYPIQGSPLNMGLILQDPQAALTCKLGFKESSMKKTGIPQKVTMMKDQKLLVGRKRAGLGRLWGIPPFPAQDPTAEPGLPGGCHALDWSLSLRHTAHGLVLNLTGSPRKSALS